MRLAFKSFLTTIFLLLTIVAFGQDFSNKGKDFWIPYPEHIDGTNSAMGIYITSDSAATGTITVAGTTLPFTLAANTVVRKFGAQCCRGCSKYRCAPGKFTGWDWCR